MFDAEEYSAAIDRFINRMEAVKTIQSPAVPEILSEMCSLLRIGKIDAAIYDNTLFESMKKGSAVCLYDGGNSDPEGFLKFREDIGNGSIAHYGIYRIIGEDDWCDAEKDKIQTIQKLIFTFNERVNLINIAEKLTYTDSQLGIKNAAFFMRYLEQIMEGGKADNYAACYFNLKRFSIVNNQAGRDSGTAVMRAFADGLQAKLEKDDCVCRIGSDNFVTLFQKEKFDIVVSYLNGTRITDPLKGGSFMISAYQGYVFLSSDSDFAPTDIMDRVSAAFNMARRSQNVPYVIYNEDIRLSMNRLKIIEDIFPEALLNEEFLVYYQPKVTLRDYTLMGAEALSRWNRGGKTIQPGSFIPVLERSKLICKLDFYVLEHVCRDIRRWLDEGKKAVRVSVNFSRVHLGDDNLLEEIMSIIDRCNVPHEYIEIELTETTTDVDYNELKKIVNGLMREGVNTSVDDFGMGYSSLNLIRELPWNVLKIDKSFLPDGTGNTKQKNTMLKYVIAMAHDLGLECIVEGVETVEQIMLLKEDNCFFVQGFYFDKPLPKEIFEKRLMGTE